MLLWKFSLWRGWGGARLPRLALGRQSEWLKREKIFTHPLQSHLWLKGIRLYSCSGWGLTLNAVSVSMLSCVFVGSPCCSTGPLRIPLLCVCSWNTSAVTYLAFLAKSLQVEHEASQAVCGWTWEKPTRCSTQVGQKREPEFYRKHWYVYCKWFYSKWKTSQLFFFFFETQVF